MIERWPARRMIQSSNRDDPVVLADGRAALTGCACHGLTGLRTDTMEPVTVLRPCSLKHEPLISRARELLIESLTDPEVKARHHGRPMLEVVYEFLVQAEKDVRAHSVS